MMGRLIPGDLRFLYFDFKDLNTRNVTIKHTIKKGGKRLVVELAKKLRLI